MPDFSQVVTIIALLTGPADIWFGWWLSERSTSKRASEAQREARQAAEVDRVTTTVTLARRLAGEARTVAHGIYLHKTAGVCGVMQRASKMPLEPAEDPSEIAAYRRRNGCAVLLVTGHPSPIPLPGAQRFRIRDYGIGANTTAGIEGFPGGQP